MKPYEDFPAATRELWRARIEKELGYFPEGGRPAPFYLSEDVPDWPAKKPLLDEPGWQLIAERFIPGEVEIWLYRPEYLEEGLAAQTWLLEPAMSLSSPPPLGVKVYQLTEGSPVAAPATAVWMLPFRLTDTLEIEGEGFSLPAEGPLHLALKGDVRLFPTALLFRALRQALAPRPVYLWAWPADTLYRPSGQLPYEGPEENLVRATLFALGALCGTAQALYLPPITSAEDPHAARWSRNVSLLLRHEVPHFAAQPDPLAGSFYIETETARIAQALHQYLHSC